MSEVPKRRSLLADLEAPPKMLDESVIAATAGRHGFVEATSAPVFETGGRIPEARRRRQPTGRVHQLNVRLKAETIEAVYAHANSRNVPVAQVIEEAMDALAGAGRR